MDNQEENNLENSKSEKEVNKDLEKAKARETGAAVGRGALDYASGGAYESLRGTPLVGDAAKLAENQFGKKFEKSPALRKAGALLNDAGVTDIANKGMDLMGAASGSKKDVKGLSNASEASSSSLDKVGKPHGNQDLMNKKSLPKEEGLNNQDNLPKDKLEDNLDNKKEEKNGENKKKGEDSKSSKTTSSQNNETDELAESEKKTRKQMRLYMILAPGIPIAFFSFLILMAFVFALLSPAKIFEEFVDNTVGKIIEFFTESDKEKEEKFYKALKEDVTSISNETNLCIDTNLIIASLTAQKNFQELYGADTKTKVLEKDNVQSGDIYENPDIVTENETNKFDYKKMRKYIKTLAYMQVRNDYYLTIDSNQSDICRDNAEAELITAENMDTVNLPGFDAVKSIDDVDSSTMDKISTHDISGVKAFFLKKFQEEKNYTYYAYHPAWSITTDINGNQVKSCDRTNVPKDGKKELSIGESYKDRKDYVFYWNLVNQFIPDYYSDYLPGDVNSDDYKERVYKIADEIYLLYDTLGKGKCLNGNSIDATTQLGISTFGSSGLCPQGITVEGYGTVEFEKYVATVVSGEADLGQDFEALKAQAIAARTYALSLSNSCTKSVCSTSRCQVYNPNKLRDEAIRAANETAGQYLTYNGHIFLSEFDSFYCKDSTTCTYTKLPNNEKHTFTLTDEKLIKKRAGGHGRGMSQIYSYELANNGYTYDRILGYFYSPGTNIERNMTISTSSGLASISSGISSILSQKGLSVEEFNQYIFNLVNQSGLGTRNSVVMAALSLTVGLPEKVGYKLPYEFGGKYKGYGLDVNWGTNTGNSGDPINSLDCSGFISWALHNGGFIYDGQSARGWSNVSTRREWFKGTTDKTAQPGDLIYSEPPKGADYSGHIRMIVGVTDDGYIVAEAGGKGVSTSKYSFTSSKKYYIVDMSDYYNSHSKVSDYPM